jgi:hypothetical protein
MVRTPVVPVAGSRPGWIALGMLVGVLSAGAANAQTPPPAQQPPASPSPSPAAQATPQKSPYVFASDAAAILNFVKADKTADFEMILGKVKDALAKSEKPERKQQASGWTVFKAAEGGPGGSVIYVALMNPTVKGSDYSVGAILAEAYPAEAQALFKTYSDCFGQPAQNILNLTLVSALGK